MASKLKPEQQEAWDALKEEVIDRAHKHGWTTSAKKGVNASFAYVTLTHEDEESPLQVFLAVDPDKGEDKFIYGSQIITGRQAREVIDTPGADDEEPDDSDPAAVPPTSAAHSAAHGDADGSAAHSDDTVPPTTDVDAAHSEQADDAARTTADVALEHIADAGDTYNQSQTYQTVKTMSDDPDRIWSAYSELSDDEILAAVDGKEVAWRNAFAKTIDRATVTPANRSGKNPPKITGFVAPGGNDTRILHFLAAGSGFRSLAIGKIKEIS